MATNLALDDRLIEEARKAGAHKTKKEAVERGLRLLLAIEGQAKIRELRGKVHWEGDLDRMRGRR